MARSNTFLFHLLFISSLASAAFGDDIFGPCVEHNLDCDACSAADGCSFCPADGTCLDLDGVDPLFPIRCSGEDEFVEGGESCAAADIYRPRFDGNDRDGGPFYSDPLYSAQAWVFKMINVLPAWRMGITGEGVHVRVNDDGFNSEHVEFAGRFDEDASCDDYMPASDETNHGTNVASVLGAAGDNGNCAVGVAPGVTFSACVSTGPNAENGGEELLTNLEAIDISQNSWGIPPCTYDPDLLPGENRALQTNGVCPFDATLRNPEFVNPCDVCNFGVDSPFDLDRNCAIAMLLHCLEETFLPQDTQACREFIDVYSDLLNTCSYVSFEYVNAVLPAIVEGIKQGRDGKGIIFVFASGNEHFSGVGLSGDSVISSRYVISVAAVGQTGEIAHYSVGGAALTVTAPAGDGELNGNGNEMVGAGVTSNTACEAISSGTSFAAPVVSGVIALMLEVNPELSWRDVQAILIATSRVPGYPNKLEMDSGAAAVESSSTTSDAATTNSAGFTHSYDFGFGIIDAHAAVTASKEWTILPDEVSFSVSTDANSVIVDDNDAVVTSSIVIGSGDMPDDGIFFTESVEVTLRLDHSSRGDLDIMLVAPSGTRSRIARGNRNENLEVESWLLTTLRTHGESPLGEWQLEIRDVSPGGSESCENRPWQPPPTRDACLIIDRLQCDDVFEFYVDNSGVSASDACCGCGGGDLTEDGWCESRPLSLSLEGFDCSVFDALEECFALDSTDDYLDMVFTQDQSTARQSCCECGGGYRDGDGPGSLDRFLGWELKVYGHVASTSPAASPVAQPTSDDTSGAIIAASSAYLLAMALVCILLDIV